jgi:hypothetical protein
MHELHLLAFAAQASSSRKSVPGKLTSQSLPTLKLLRCHGKTLDSGRGALPALSDQPNGIELERSVLSIPLAMAFPANSSAIDVPASNYI